MKRKPATRIITVPADDYNVVLFFDKEGGAEAVISGDSEQKPATVKIAPPDEGRRIVVRRSEGVLQVQYEDVT